MTKYLKYLPYVLALVLFLAGRWTAPQPDKELRKKFEAERESILEVIGQKDAQIVRLKDDRAKERERRVSDSLRSARALARQESITAALKKENERINYKNYSNPDLDSIDAILFGSR